MKFYNVFLKGNIRYTSLICFLAGFFCLFLPAGITFARDVSFVWSPNPETVDGYRIYYKTGSSGVPYDGTGAVEGASPVATGNVTTFILHSLSDTETYYFVLTAYIGTLESDYSTEIVLPGSTPATTERTVSFAWSANPEAVDGYRIYYKDITVGSSCPLPSDVPYNGQDATEGPSPVEAGNVTTYTLQGLSFDKAYCFALTAYLGTQESDYSQPLELTGDNPPVATAVLVSTFENTPVSGQLPASDPDGDALTYSIVTNGTLGAATITNTSNGSFTYTPNTNVSGSDSFTFKVNDGKLDSNTATATITIAAVNAAPTATGGFFVTDENTPANGQLIANDPDGDNLTYSIVANGTLGTVNITNAATGAFTYAPNTDATGSDSFTFKVNDGMVDSNTATVSVTINVVNDPPTTSGAAISTNENTPYTGQLPASDPDGDALTYSIVTNGTLGTANITNTATGATTYTPNTDATGSDSFTFKVNDGTVDSNTSTVTVTIAAVNDPPTASGSALSTDEDTVYSGQLSASDPDGDALTYSIVTGGTLGTANITDTATGAFTYTPNADVTGSDSFSFKVNDGAVDSNTATVTVTIAVVNDPPTASGTSLLTDEDTVYSGQLSANDPEGDALTYSIVTNGTLGTANITNAATGAFTYTPNADATGSDSFSFMANDGAVGSNTATVTVTIAAVNDPPTASGTSLSTDEDTETSGQLSASDPEGDALTYSIVTGGTLGTANITDAATGAFTYTPNADATGSDPFTFMVNDGTVDSNTATVTVTIAAVNDPPYAIEYSVSTDVNTTYTGQLLASDREGDPLAYSIVTNGTLGTANITNAATGVFTYTPDTDATGSDSFTFKANDGMADSVEAVVTIVIFDATIITKIFGDIPGADYPGTLEDTYTNLNTDLNETGETLLTWSWLTSGPHKVANTIIMKADLAGISTYATIYEATLFLYQTSATGEAEYINSVHKIIGKNPIINQVTGYNAFNGEAWSPVPDNTTHNNIPLGLADIDVQQDSILLLTQQGYRSWQITDMVQEWINNPSVNYGLLIQGEETTLETRRVFAASENPTAGIRPKLVIRYTITPPAPNLILIEEIK